MNVCFWCRRKMNEGDNDGDPEYLNYDKCLECASKADLGITMIQVTKEPNGNPMIHPEYYPTGKWMVIPEDTMKDMFRTWDGLPITLETRHTFIDIETWENYKLPN